jgi:LacI family transcriptional regulator
MVEPNSPKYVTVAAQIEALVQAGRWTGNKLPSVRDIASDYGVSVVTASRALQVLRDKGLIASVERSGSFLIEPTSRPGEAWALCLRLTPGTWLRATAAVLNRGFEAMAKTDGITIRSDLFDSDGVPPKELPKQLREAKEQGVRGVFLLPSRLSEASRREDLRFIDACRAAGLPVVLIERNLRGAGRELTCDLVGTDDVAGGATLTQHLLRRGRQRVACIVASPTSTHEERLAGYLLAIEEARRAGKVVEPCIIPQSTDLCDRGVLSELAERLIRAKADGAVCYTDYVAMGLIVEFLARGVKVPKEIALTGFDDLPVGSAFALGVTSFVFPAEEVARQAVRVMRERIRRPEMPPFRVLVPGRLVIRDSCGGRNGG